MKKKKLVFGLGTGRCGTVSLSKFLCLQDGCRVTHEKGASPISWYNSFDLVQTLVEQKLMNSSDEDKIVGDVAFFWLPYVEFIIKEVTTNLKVEFLEVELYFICLKRDKQKTIDSFRRWQRWDSNKRHPWYSGPDYPDFSVYDKCYPKFGFISRRDAASLYWDMYYKIASILCRKYPDKFRVFYTEDLNSEQGQRKILRFLQIEEGSMIVDKNLPRWNKGVKR